MIPEGIFLVIHDQLFFVCDYFFDVKQNCETTNPAGKTQRQTRKRKYCSYGISTQSSGRTKNGFDQDSAG